MPNKIIPSGPNGSCHRQDMLELRCHTPQLSKLPIQCIYAEVIQNEDDKEPHNVVFKIDDDFFGVLFQSVDLAIALLTHAHMLL